MKPEEFIKQVEKLLLERYLIGIVDCTNEDTILACHKAGETPEEVVDWIGSKYNLDRCDLPYLCG